MADHAAKGSRLCGKVAYEIQGNLGIFQYCHCPRCRKFTGSAFASNLLVAPEDFRWLSGQESVGRFESENAKHFATPFCTHCGSSLPWLTQSGKAVVVRAGTLDEDPEIRPVKNIYCASKAHWFEEPSDLPRYDERPGRSR